MPKQSNSDAKLREELEAAGVTPTTTTNKGAPASTTEAKTDTKEGDKQTRTRIPSGAKPSEALALHVPDQAELLAATRPVKSQEPSKERWREVSKRIDGLAKKVGEKAVNLIRFQSAPDNVQVYTRMGLDHLLANGTVTSKDLVNMFATTGRKYSPGTSRAQANQVMQLFPALEIAERNKSELTLNKQSTIVASYRKAATK